MSLETWYHVSFDKEYIYRKVDPPGGEGWNDKCRWDDIIRICFQPGDFLQTDEIYIFTSEREESYLIPIDADGGHLVLDGKEDLLAFTHGRRSSAAKARCSGPGIRRG